MTTAVVVARGGSVRLPNKALLPFAGTTLIGHKVRQLKRCANVGRVVVGSDSAEILAEAKANGADVIQRDPRCCDESLCSANEMIADMVGRLAAEDELILWAHPTNPLVRPETYDAAVREYLAAMSRGEADSLVSVTRVQRHSWVDNHPANFSPWISPHKPASQLPSMYFQDGAIFIQPRAQMVQNSYFFGVRPLLFEVDAVEGWDIDTQRDYEAAIALCKLPS